MRFTPSRGAVPTNEKPAGEVCPTASPEFFSASCNRDLVKPCTLPSDKPTFRCLECRLSTHPTRLFAAGKLVPKDTLYIPVELSLFCNGVGGGLPFPRL